MWGWVVNATPGRERPGTQCLGGWVGIRAGLDGCGKFHPIRIRPLDRPACSESLYRLSYPGAQEYMCIIFIAFLGKRVSMLRSYVHGCPVALCT
jgi:hypothetical protein